MKPNEKCICLSCAIIGLLLTTVGTANVFAAGREDGNKSNNKLYDFNDFKHIVETSNDSHAVSVGDALFDRLAEKYKNDAGFIALKSKLENATSLSNQMRTQLEKTSNKYVLAVTDEVLAKGKRNNRNYLLSMTPAKSFYETSGEIFSKPINIAHLEDEEKIFLTRYYDLKLRILTNYIVQAGRALTIVDPNFEGTYDYALVLPLLHTPAQNPVNINMLPRWMQKPDQLYALSDSCLLKFGLLFQAMMLAQKSAEVQNKEFSLVDFYKTAAIKCGKTHPNIAADCLRKTIDCTPEGNLDVRIALQFQLVQTWLDAENYPLAAGDSQKIFETYPDHNESGKAFWIYYYALSKSNNVDKILADIDKALENKHCEPYKARLMYVKWWALCHKRDQSAKKTALEYDMLKQFGDDQIIAPVLLSRATDFLANQDYTQARELLTQLLEKFPSTNTAGQAQAILTKLDSVP